MARVVISLLVLPQPKVSHGHWAITVQLVTCESLNLKAQSSCVRNSNPDTSRRRLLEIGFLRKILPISI